MHLNTALPDADMVPWIHSYRQYRFTKNDPAVMTMFPGTGAEVWFVLSGQLQAGNHPVGDGLLCLRHTGLDFRQQKLVIFSVRLRAGALPFFLKTGMPHVIDAFSPLPSVWGDDGTYLSEHIRGCGDFAAQCHEVGAFLRRRCNAGRRLEPMQCLAANVYEDCAGFSLEEMSKKFERHRSAISHSFHETQGVSIKYFHRICRFERFVRDALFAPQASLSDLSLVYGYYDQAHMNRDIRLLTGKTPVQLRDMSASRLFYTPRRTQNIIQTWNTSSPLL